jgi:hypothetical protein
MGMTHHLDLDSYMNQAYRVLQPDLPQSTVPFATTRAFELRPAFFPLYVPWRDAGLLYLSEQSPTEADLNGTYTIYLELP